MKKIIIILLLNFTLMSAQNKGGILGLEFDYKYSEKYSNAYKVGFSLFSEDHINDYAKIGHISFNFYKKESDKSITTVNAALLDFVMSDDPFGVLDNMPSLFLSQYGLTLLDYDKSEFFDSDLNWITIKYGYAFNDVYLRKFDEDSRKFVNPLGNFKSILFVNFKAGYNSIIFGDDYSNIRYLTFNEKVNGPFLGFDFRIGLIHNYYSTKNWAFFWDSILDLSIERFYNKNKNLDILDYNLGFQLGIADHSPYDMPSGIAFTPMSGFDPLILSFSFKNLIILLPEQVNAHGFEIRFKTNLIGLR